MTDDEEIIELERQPNGHFAPGNKVGFRGRPKGARSRLGERFFAALLADFEQHGAKAIETVRRKFPSQWLRSLAYILRPSIDELRKERDGDEDFGGLSSAEEIIGKLIEEFPEMFAEMLPPRLGLKTAKSRAAPRPALPAPATKPRKAPARGSRPSGGQTKPASRPQPNRRGR